MNPRRGSCDEAARKLAVAASIRDSFELLPRMERTKRLLTAGDGLERHRQEPRELLTTLTWPATSCRRGV